MTWILVWNNKGSEKRTIVSSVSMPCNVLWTFVASEETMVMTALGLVIIHTLKMPKNRKGTDRLTVVYSRWHLEMKRKRRKIKDSQTTKIAKDLLVMMLAIYRWSFNGEISGLFLALRVFSTPTPAQWTSPEINETRICWRRAKFWSCSISQLRSFYDIG